MRQWKISWAGLHVSIDASRESAEVIRQRQETEFRRTNNYFEGDFTSWKEASEHSLGYASPLILDKLLQATRAVVRGDAAYERDTVLFKLPALSHPLLFALLYVAGISAGRLSVLDFGGSLGGTYRQHSRFLSHLQDLSWGVVEQPSVAVAGQAEFQKPPLKFFDSMDDCAQVIQPNFMLLSGVLHYLEDPYAFLIDAFQKNIPYVFIDRAMAHRRGRDRLAVQHVPAAIYDASYPVWLMSAAHMEDVFVQSGYEVMDSFDPYPGSEFGPSDFRSSHIGWFLRRKAGDQA